jgi:hypothetical protein
MSRRTKAALWAVFVLFDVAVALLLWSRSESWPWRTEKPWIYDDAPVFPVGPASRR